MCPDARCGRGQPGCKAQNRARAERDCGADQAANSRAAMADAGGRARAHCRVPVRGHLRGDWGCHGRDGHRTIRYSVRRWAAMIDTAPRGLDDADLSQDFRLFLAVASAGCSQTRASDLMAMQPREPFNRGKLIERNEQGRIDKTEPADRMVFSQKPYVGFWADLAAFFMSNCHCSIASGSASINGPWPSVAEKSIVGNCSSGNHSCKRCGVINTPSSRPVARS